MATLIETYLRDADAQQPCMGVGVASATSPRGREASG